MLLLPKIYVDSARPVRSGVNEESKRPWTIRAYDAAFYPVDISGVEARMYKPFEFVAADHAPVYPQGYYSLHPSSYVVQLVGPEKYKRPVLQLSNRLVLQPLADAA